MTAPSESIRALAERLLADEAAGEFPSGAEGNAAVRMCERLRIPLTQFVGADGFTALLRRAVILARTDVPALKTATVSADGRLQISEDFAAGGANHVDAAIAITAYLLHLLVTFIGESLTLRLIRVAWPNSAGRKIVDPEDSL